MREKSFRECVDATVGERVLLGRTSSGMAVRVAPTQRFRETSAVVTFGYGSTDLGFARNGAVHWSPEGVAHYLEHKLFEDEELHVFERFGQRGTQVNAMTGFGRTTYYFHGHGPLGPNLTDLLRLVSRAHLTEANVEKERGIIAQELRMYEDSPEYRGFFELLRCLYAEHPVRNPVGGTVESIQDIDVAELEACYSAYYRSGNAGLCVAGPVDADEVLELAESCDLAAGDAPRSECPDDLGPAPLTRGRCEMELARPRLLLGFKERSILADASERSRRDLVTRMYLDHLFGAASHVRQALHERGVIDDSLSASYTSERTFGFAVAACETEDHERVTAELHEVLRAPVAIGDDDLERMRRKMLGRYVRGFESVQHVAMEHAEEALLSVEPFEAIERMQGIRVDDIVARQQELCRDDSFAAVVVG
ncbi:MAG: insulinase family protein [Planctomycetes bacterium]|nr:insulinase family protein [Planctomycetota bacterium]